MTMEELVNKLANLQSERSLREEAAEEDELVIEYSEKITRLEKELKKFQQARAQELAYYAPAIDDIKVDIEEIKKQIIDTWDGKKKTMPFDVGTLKFRTTGSLRISDREWLLSDLLDHTTIEDVAEKYIKGFNMTAVKKYMSVHNLPVDVAEIEYKTTVKLEEES